MAQTNLSELAKGGQEVAERLDCGGLSAALPRLLAPRRAQSGDESPQSKRCARFVSALPKAAAGCRTPSPRGGAGVALTPWLQPGVGRLQKAMNRFNGLSRRAEAVETAHGFSAGSLHRADATVLMRVGIDEFSHRPGGGV